MQAANVYCRQLREVMPNKGAKIPSGPWGRLKPVEQDPLESFGLPSKGDTR